MDITVICAENKFSFLKNQIENLGMKIISEKEEDNTLVVQISSEGYEILSEIPGIISIEKSSIYDLFKDTL